MENTVLQDIWYGINVSNHVYKKCVDYAKKSLLLFLTGKHF